MSNARTIVIAGLALAVLCVAARVLVPYRPAVPQTEPKSAGSRARSARPRQATDSARSRVTPPLARPRSILGQPQGAAPAPNTPQAASQQPEAGTQKAAGADTGPKKAAPANAKTPNATAATPGARPGKPPIQDPMARAALAYVGADPDAEMYWYQAINDPSLPAQERQDLIEDLNEDGLSDPHHPTTDDLPLILSRIELIEEVVWDAMDEVNADAFLEAYKDLVNLAFQALDNS